MPRFGRFLFVGALLWLGALAGPAAAAELVPLAAFAPGSLPEGVALDRQGNVYAGIATTGEIKRIAPGGAVSTLATLRKGQGFLLARGAGALAVLDTVLPKLDGPTVAAAVDGAQSGDVLTPRLRCGR